MRPFGRFARLFGFVAFRVPSQPTAAYPKSVARKLIVDLLIVVMNVAGLTLPLCYFLVSDTAYYETNVGNRVYGVLSVVGIVVATASLLLNIVVQRRIHRLLVLLTDCDVIFANLAVNPNYVEQRRFVTYLLSAMVFLLAFLAILYAFVFGYYYDNGYYCIVAVFVLFRFTILNAFCGFVSLCLMGIYIRYRAINMSIISTLNGVAMSEIAYYTLDRPRVAVDKVVVIKELSNVYRILLEATDAFNQSFSLQVKS